MNSQYERTRLAWRRTILALIVIGGIGSVHLATAGYLVEAGLVVVLAVSGVLPAMHRLRGLRNERPVAGWEPLAVTASACLMALSVVVPA